MNKNTKDNRVIVFTGLLLVAFILFNFVGADEEAMNYFQDRDQDGLSDEEEKALGTDWQKEDTDDDGYTDGVELSSGYNPLIPAPGDKLSDGEAVSNRNKIKVSGEKKEKINLTQEFITKLKNRKQTTLNVFQEASAETGLVTDITEIQKLKNTSLTEDDIKELTQETLQDVDIDEETKLIEEDKFNILPKVISKNNRKKEEVIKKEIEAYLATTGFIMINSLPFKVDENSDFNKKLDSFMMGIGEDIVIGSKTETKNSKNNLRKSFGELQEIDVPYVLKDIHIRALSLLKYLLEQDEAIVFSKNDPIAMGLMIGRLQAIINEMQDVQIELDEILLKYGVGVDSEQETTINEQKIENSE